MSTRDLFAEYGNDIPLNRIPLHRNPGLEIVYVEEGQLTMSCEGSSEVVPAGSVYFTLPWQEHGSARHFEFACKLHFIVAKLLLPKSEYPTNFRFKPEIGFSRDTEVRIARLLSRTRRHTWPASPLMKALMPEILRELQHPGPLHLSRVQTLLKQIILDLAQTIHQGTPPPSAPQSSAWRIRRLLEILDHEYDHKWTLPDMAAESGLKRSQFSEIFKQVTGEPPVNYLINLRIQRAIQLLEGSSLSVTEIALHCGFSSSQHFANLFKKKTGCTPLEYRRNGPPEIQIPRKMP